MGRISNDKSVSSQDRLFGAHTIIHDGEPYMTRFWFWRFRVHIFHRGDKDQDCHDHPWDFWTFPLTSYVEEVLHPVRQARLTKAEPPPDKFFRSLQVVERFRLHYRPAEHCHRVLGAWSGRYESYSMFTGENLTKRPVPGSKPQIAPGKKIVTLVYQSGVRRKWGFWKERNGVWCWDFWKKYVLEGGRDQACR